MVYGTLAIPFCSRLRDPELKLGKSEQQLGDKVVEQHTGNFDRVPGEFYDGKLCLPRSIFCSSSQ